MVEVVAQRIVVAVGEVMRESAGTLHMMECRKLAGALNNFGGGLNTPLVSGG